MKDFHSTSGLQTERIEYIDALRGFIMFLVVFNHMAGYCWHIKHNWVSMHDMLELLQMPMFFFVSGFVFYKANVIWSGRQVISFLKRKFPLFIIAPFFFFIPYLHFLNVSFYHGITDVFKMGYWYTFVLFVYYVFYVIIKFLFGNRWATVILLVLGLFLCFIVYRPIYDAIPLSADVKGLLSIDNWMYFFYFVLGTLSREYFQQFDMLLDSKWFLPVCIVFFFFTIAFRDYFSDGAIGLPRCLAGMVILFSFFRIHQSSFSKDCTLGRTLQFMGRRTLDIYWIHFFFIPVNLKIFTLFHDCPMPVVEALVSFIIACLMIACSILVGNIIRLSPLLAHWLFGAKLPKKDASTPS